MKLLVNTVLEWRGTNPKAGTQSKPKKPRRERIVSIDQARGKVALIRLELDKALPEWSSLDELQKAFTEGTVVQPKDDLWGPPQLNEGQAEDWKIKWRDKSWELIKPLVNARIVQELFARRSRRRLIASRAKEAKVCENTVRKALRHFFQRGQCRNALLPDFHRCGAPGLTREVGLGTRGRPRKNGKANLSISVRARELLQLGFRKYYVCISEANWLDAYTLTIGEYFSVGREIKNGILTPILRKRGTYPSQAQFKYWASQAVSAILVVRKRIGERRFLKGKRGLGSSSMALVRGPGLYQIDCTVADIYLVSAIDQGCVVGRPVLYIVIDVFTRMIVGYHLSLDPPSGQTALLAIANAGCDKVEHCRRLKITILPEEWPAQHLPSWIIGDRGEMLSERLDSLADKLKIDTSVTPPYRCDLKGIVERCFGKLNNRIIKWLPGFVKKDRERGCPDPRLKAQLTLIDFEKLIVCAILAHNRSHIPSYPRQQHQLAKRVPAIPVKLWHLAVESGESNLLPYNENRVHLATLKKGDATVKKDGILFNKLRYTCKQSKDQEWLTHARMFGKKSIDVVFNPDRAGSVFHTLPSGSLEPLTLVPDDQHFEYCSIAEVDDHFSRLHEENREGAHNNLQVRLELMAQQKAILLEAEDNNNALGNCNDKSISKRKKTQNIRISKAKERQAQRLKRIGAPSAISPLSKESLAGADAPKNVISFHSKTSHLVKGQTDYVPPPQDLDLLG